MASKCWYICNDAHVFQFSELHLWCRFIMHESNLKKIYMIIWMAKFLSFFSDGCITVPVESLSKEICMIKAEHIVKVQNSNSESDLEYGPNTRNKGHFQVDTEDNQFIEYDQRLHIKYVIHSLLETFWKCIIYKIKPLPLYHDKNPSIYDYTN